MPLSEHEERILAEIERQLADEDPRFASRSRRASFRGPLTSWSPTLRFRLAVVLGVVGLLSVLALAIDVIFAAVGIALLFGAVILGATALRDRSAAGPGAPRSPDEHAP